MSATPMKEVSYAHRDAPNGTRFIGMANDKIPVWAVDVKPHDSSMVNWMGLPIHPTDTLLTGHEKAAEVLALRVAYDQIAAAGLLGALETLQAAAKNKEAMANAESEAGQDW
jgi:hypothetical protein